MGNESGATCKEMLRCFSSWLFRSCTRPVKDIQEAHCILKLPEIRIGTIEKTIKAQVEEESQPEMKMETIDQLVLLDLPGHLVDRIFLMCSVKTLLRLRCVCKAWRSRIDDPNFKNCHLNFKRNYAILAGCYKTGLHILKVDKYSFSLHKEKLSLSLKQFGHFFIPVAECNGLICLGDFPNFYYIVNPATRQFIALPTLHFTFPDFGLYHPICELTFDASAGSYKMLVGNTNEVMVITVGIDHSWRCLGHIPEFKVWGKFWSSKAMPYVNGAIHWIYERNCTWGLDFILAFDVGSEKFLTISYPPKCCPGDNFCRRNRKNSNFLVDATGNHSHCVCLAEKEGMLRFLHFDAFAVNMDMWLLKEYKSGLWVKEYRLEREFIPEELHYLIRARPLLLPLSDMIVFDFEIVRGECSLEGWRVTAYHPDKRQFYFLECKAESEEDCAIPFLAGDAIPYFESLVHWNQFPRLMRNC